MLDIYLWMLFIHFILKSSFKRLHQTGLTHPQQHIYGQIFSPIVCNSIWKLQFKLKEEEVMTLLLDGWTDVLSNSIYGLILLFGYSESDILEIFDFSSERHTAENLLLEVSNIVNSSCINWAQIKCCCTDRFNIANNISYLAYKHSLNN